MKILHTSDWHLGRNLYGRRRYDEYDSFLKWLVTTIDAHQIEALIVAGDIFDTGTPSNRAQQLYYSFLRNVSGTSCRHIIITGGNHDSPTLLEAPKELLRFFQIHVVGSAQSNIEDEVLRLTSADNEDELIVCAVPYLRDRDIRTAVAGEDFSEKSKKLLKGIEEHYSLVAKHAQSVQQESPNRPPIIATGHLFAAGGRQVEGDGVRELYVGSLVYVQASIFDDCFSYVALGHLHSNQRVDNNPNIRYSGSPLPMSFGEAEKEKSVNIVHLTPDGTKVDTLTVPRFQTLKTLRGNLAQLLKELASLAKEKSSIWLEVIYDGEEIVGNLPTTLHEAIEGTSLEILRIINLRVSRSVLNKQKPDETLATMTCEKVFQRCLEAHHTPPDQQEELLNLFQQTLQEVEEEDEKAQ